MFCGGMGGPLDVSEMITAETDNALVQYPRKMERFVSKCQKVDVHIWIDRSKNRITGILTALGVTVASLLSLVCGALELCLLHSPLPSLHSSLPPCETSLRQHNPLFSHSTTVAAAAPSAWLSPPPPTHTHPNLGQPAYQRAGRPVSGPVPDGLGQQCVLGLRPLKRGAFHRRGAFVRRCLLLTRQLFKALLASTGEVKGRNLTSD